MNWCDCMYLNSFRVVALYLQFHWIIKAMSVLQRRGSYSMVWLVQIQQHVTLPLAPMVTLQLLAHKVNHGLLPWISNWTTHGSPEALNFPPPFWHNKFSGTAQIHLPGLRSVFSGILKNRIERIILHLIAKYCVSEWPSLLLGLGHWRERSHANGPGIWGIPDVVYHIYLVYGYRVQ